MNIGIFVSCQMNRNTCTIHIKICCIGFWLCYNYNRLYHGAWAIAMVTFDVLREIYAHNLPVDREI